jgi:hypothetical protein
MRLYLAYIAPRGQQHLVRVDRLLGQRMVMHRVTVCGREWCGWRRAVPADGVVVCARCMELSGATVTDGEFFL